MAAVSPRQKSTYSWPSTSVKRAPCASAAKTGKPPARLDGQLAGARMLALEALELAREKGVDRHHAR
jgi:hypothetical protein